MINKQTQIDVAIVGGSIAGCASAILFARMGHKVVVFEQKFLGDDAHYKRLCTHFLQPSSVPILDELGLGHLRQPSYSVQTQAMFVTAGGMIDHPHAYGEDGAYALNLERRVLDPALRSAARAHGVKIIDSCVVAGIERTNEGWLLTSDDDKSQISARLLVAADGRQSRIAKQLENPTELKPNDRAAVFGYFFGIAQPSQQRSVFILHEGEMAFIYPLPHGKTLLSVYIKKDRARQWHNAESIELELLRYIGSLPGAPEIGNASIQSPVSGYMDYPNQIREPVHRSVAFIGDAALSLDPMSGVGCGFALTGAQLLADAFKNCELSDSKIEEALRNFDLGYRKTITPHASGICADSLTGKDTDAQKRAYQAISTNIELSKAYLALTGRLLLPVDFQRAFLRSSLARPTVFS